MAIAGISASTTRSFLKAHLMDKRERIEDFTEMLNAALAAFRSELWTSAPGIVQSFDAATQTCSVQLSIRSLARQQAGAVESLALPLLVDCPVQFPAGGNCTLTFPVKSGDECLVVFAARSVDGWWQSGGVQEQAETRTHSLSDGFVLLGFRSQPRALSGVSTTTTQLRSDDGDTYVDLDPAGKVVKIKAPTGIVMDTPVVTVTGVIVAQNQQGIDTAFSVAGKISVDGDVVADGVSLIDHAHSGVLSGGEQSGPPIPSE